METVSFSDASRYLRQEILPEFGSAGQARLREASVLLIGIGGLGSPIALYLAAAGVGRITLCDPDTVDITNLHRQILYGDSDQGFRKVEVAKRKLQNQYPDTTFETVWERFNAENSARILSGQQILIDASDNFKTRDFLNSVSLQLPVPLVQASLLRFEGQLTTFDGLGGPCYRCLYGELPPAPNCAEAGVLGPLVGIMGSYQALESIKILAQMESHRFGELIRFDALKNRWTKLAIAADPDCPSCHGHKRERVHKMSSIETIQLPPQEVARLVAEKRVELLDVREPEERAIAHLGGTFLPLSELSTRYSELSRDTDWVIYCHHGVRSLHALGFLRQMGFEKVRNLQGGIDRWSIEVDPKVARY